MAQRFIAFAAIIFASIFAFAAEPFGQVKNYAELLSTKPITVDGKWEVRLGWSDSGESGGPWALVYAQAKWLGEGDPAVFRGKVNHETLLGPMTMTVEQKKDMQRVEAESKMWIPALPREGLYCEAIPVAWKGNYIIKIFDSKDQIVAQTEIDIAEPRPCYWHSFADDVYRDEVWSYVVLGKSQAVYPKLDGVHSLLPLHDANLPETRPANALIRQQGDASLKLSLKDGHFQIESDFDMLDWPDETLMARWWVNGKPVEAPRGERTARAEARLVANTRNISILFGYPDSLSAKPGDVISLQLMYVPGYDDITEKWEDSQLMQAIAKRSIDLHAMALSNKIEFKLTDDLVKLRDKNAKE